MMGGDMNALVRIQSSMANIVVTSRTENYNKKVDTTMENFKGTLAGFFKMEN